MNPSPEIRPLAPQDHAPFAHMVQMYLAEIAPALPAPGSDRVAQWWTDSDRIAFALHASDLAGFALVHRLSNETYEFSEFYITPPQRRRGLGRWFAVSVTQRFPGRWRLGLAAGAKNARAFWINALSGYQIKRGPPLTDHQSGSLHFIVKETSP